MHFPVLVRQVEFYFDVHPGLHKDSWAIIPLVLKVKVRFHIIDEDLHCQAFFDDCCFWLISEDTGVELKLSYLDVGELCIHHSKVWDVKRRLDKRIEREPVRQGDANQYPRVCGKGEDGQE